MTKTLILIALLVLIYLYWKAQQNKTLPQPDDNPDDIIERKGKNKETFWDANDWEVKPDNEDNTIFGPEAFVPVTKKDSLGNSPEEEKPILSHKQHRQLKKAKNK